MSETIRNEVFIRGMLVAKYKSEDKTTAVICCKSISKERSNYQYVTFFGKEKEKLDAMSPYEGVVVTARVWSFRDKDTKEVNVQNIRLRGKTIESSIEFSKKIIAVSGIPYYGIQIKDCVRFNFSGKIISMREIKPGKLSIFLGVSDPDNKSFNIIPLVCSKEEEEIDYIRMRYEKGSTASVSGFVSQREDEGGSGKKKKHINTYFVTSFLESETDFMVNEKEGK